MILYFCYDVKFEENRNSMEKEEEESVVLRVEEGRVAQSQDLLGKKKYLYHLTCHGQIHYKTF